VPYTLPKFKILRGYQSFSRIIGSGVRIQEKLLTGYVLVRSSVESDSVIGFAVTKKRVPLAVQRNRIKRIMKESVRKNFYEISQMAEFHKVAVEIVLSYSGKKETDYRRLKLQDIETDWLSIQKNILKLL
jgi:ribonuclease P protein component